MPDSLKSRFRSALVTGASTGLGEAFAGMLRLEHVGVWGTARDVSRFEKSPLAHPLVMDLEQPHSIKEAWSRAEQESGGIDLLINNAGFGVFGEFADGDFETWRRQIDAMLTNTLLLNQIAFKAMKARGRGAIVNVSSLAVEYPLPYMLGYNVAKSGLSAASESMMIEATGTGVTIIDFRPGDHRTRFNRSMQRVADPQGPIIQSDRIKSLTASRMARAWEVLERNLAHAPLPDAAAVDLRRALLRGRSGTVRTGSIFQTRIASLFGRWAPEALRRWAHRRHFGL